ncbi:MAG: 8-oxo-dGTP diphosphatase [Candidatus Paceibacteria bacterium]|jgi:8-oxo-dGTP diphosphatase
MRELKIINPENIKDLEVTKFRKRVAARAVIFDTDDKIALLKVSTYNYYKLPGGGVEGGETIKQGLEREAEEEIGCDIEIGEELGMVIEYRGQQELFQESHNFFAKVVGDKNKPNFTESEIESGYEIHWVDLDEAIVLVADIKTNNYGGQFMVERDLAILKEAKSRLNSEVSN